MLSLLIKILPQIQVSSPPHISSAISELQNQHEEIIEDNKPINSTFTLRIDNQGNLVGLNIKKPKSTKDSKFRRFLHFKRTISSESEEKEIENLNIKEKIKGIFSKLKPK